MRYIVLFSSLIQHNVVHCLETLFKKINNTTIDWRHNFHDFIIVMLFFFFLIHNLYNKNKDLFCWQMTEMTGRHTTINEKILKECKLGEGYVNLFFETIKIAFLNTRGVVFILLKWNLDKFPFFSLQRGQNVLHLLIFY